MWQCSVVWYFQCLYQCSSTLLCDTVSDCTNLALLCSVILPGPVPVWQCSLLWVYCECLYHWGGALFCDTISACTNVAVVCFVIMWVPVPMWQCSVVWYSQCLYQCGGALLCDTSQCLYQCGSALLCDNVSACTNVALFCCVILSVPVPMWRCSVVWYCECLYQCGSALCCHTLTVCSMWQFSFVWYSQSLYQCGGVLWCDTTSACTNMAVLSCVIMSVLVPVWQCFCHGMRRPCVLWRLS